MRARTRWITAALAAVATAGGVAVVPHPHAEPVPAPVDPAVHAVSVVARMEAEADAAGVAAERADEALLEHRGSAADAAAAERTLVALARRQEPRLESAAALIGPALAHPAATVELASRSGASRELRALAFARRQVGKPYRYAATGPRAYDCSGLTMRAYRAAGVGIGGHGATRQWRDAQRHHRLVAYRHARRGDLIFYGRPGAVYHVAIYAGHGRMIEAPYPGKPVREVAVRRAGRLAQVARPA